MERVPEAEDMPDVVRTYARSRFFLRLRFLNYLRKEDLAEKRAQRRADKRVAEAATAEALAGIPTTAGAVAGTSSAVAGTSSAAAGTSSSAAGTSSAAAGPVPKRARKQRGAMTGSSVAR